jgi:hypothetical protein
MESYSIQAIRAHLINFLAVMLMRAYAFAGRSAQVLVLLLVFYAALVGISIWFFCFNTVPLPDLVYEILGGTGCFPDYAALHGGSRIIVRLSGLDELND